MNNTESLNYLGSKLTGETIAEGNDLAALVATAKALDPDGDYAATSVTDALMNLGDAVEAGGGSGDLDTASVHVVIEGVGDMSMFGSIIEPDLQRTVPNYLFLTSTDVDVVLYKGTAQVTASTKGADIVTRGFVTYDSEDMVYIVTGECTFTVSGK